MAAPTLPFGAPDASLIHLPAEELSSAELAVLSAIDIEDPEKAAAHVMRHFRNLGDSQLASLRWDWSFWGRPDQQPPAGRWRIWPVIAGRGAGKTRTGSEWVRKKGPQSRVGLLVGATPADVRDLMVEHGPSALRNVCPPNERPNYEPSKRLVTWPNGAIAHIRAASDPEDIRGVSADWAWCDEIGKWRYAREAWDNLRFALREGDNPQTVITTTPKPMELLRQILGVHPTLKPIPGTVMGPRTSTFRNRGNLSADFLEEMVALYLGSRLGTQELEAVLLEDVEGALWSWAMIENCRWEGEWFQSLSGIWAPALPAFKRKIVAVDPPGSSTGAECGIIVLGVDLGRPPRAYVLDDRSIRGTPGEWGAAAVQAYFDHGCDLMIGEVNYGGEMVGNTIDTVPEAPGYPAGRAVRYRPIRTGKKSKAQRAQPVVALYEMHPSRVVHVGRFPELEYQQTSWDPNSHGESPDRVDALVHGVAELLVLHPPVVGTSNADQILSGRIA